MTSKSATSRPGQPVNKSTVSSAVPNQSLYCTNLPDKLQKQDLRLSLYALFSTYGPVLDVVALKTPKMRGQAHIVFRDIQASTQAMRALQGFEFFGKEIVIQYARKQSNILSKLSGEFTMPAPAGGEVTATELQQSIFNAPPGSMNAVEPTPGAGRTLKPPTLAEGAKSPQGVKRAREENDENEEDVPMDEDDDGDAPMEDSSEED